MLLSIPLPQGLASEQTGGHMCSLAGGSERLAHASFRSSRGLYSGVPYRKKDATGEVMPLSAHGRVIRKYCELQSALMCGVHRSACFACHVQLAHMLAHRLLPKAIKKAYWPQTFEWRCTVYMSLVSHPNVIQNPFAIFWTRKELPCNKCL